MKKLLFLLISIFFLTISVKAQVPSATCSLSNATPKAGEIVVMTVNIKKCDLACYAQYQQLLPEGFTATEISGQSDNANFYFENNKVFYQWYKLPIDKSVITLKYNLAIAPGTKIGKYDIPGYFSYQMKNRLGEIETPISIEVK